MPSDAFIFQEFKRHSLPRQVELLKKALVHMQADRRRSEAECISLAMELPIFPEVVRIDEIKDYLITVTFDNQKQRTANFREFFKPEKRLEKILLNDPELFNTVEVEEGTLIWRKLGITSIDFEGKEQFYYFDIDPGWLYENSTPVMAKMDD